MTMPTYEELHDDDITDAVLARAARLFSKHYGVWGTPPASFSNPFVKPGISFFSQFRLLSAFTRPLR